MKGRRDYTRIPYLYPLTQQNQYIFATRIKETQIRNRINLIGAYIIQKNVRDTQINGKLSVG